ncbi:MAG: PAS domain S-box protein [Spirochaetes bacterium]|nr:PAS domain S-box protein [Spirochaetota bacterium]MBU1081895.1 PAS domain S-box protein [Spirochaetota bacterium]
MLASCLALVAVSTLAEFLIQYRGMSRSIAEDIERVRLAQTPVIESALWSSDSEQLQALVSGMLFFPYISYVEVRDLDGRAFSAGDREPGGSERSYRLFYEYGDREIDLGTIELRTDTGKIISDITGQIIVSLALQAFLLFFASALMFALFERMVTRHLVLIAAHVRENVAGSAYEPLALDKRRRGDEIDTLVDAFNRSFQGLSEAREAERRAMVELRRSEERNRNLVEEAPDAIMVFDVDLGRFVDCNRSAERLLGEGREWILGIGIEDLYAVDQPDGLPVGASVAANQELVLSGRPQLVQRNLRIPSGGIVVCDVRLSRFPSEDRRLIRASYLDVGDRVRAEKAVATSLREKEVLLQEVYHRTKNNMQVIASLLDMQTYYSDDEGLRGVMKEMVGRIKSMALIHQKLYESRDLSRIDLKEYVEDLVREIRRGFLDGRSGVEIRVEAEEGIVALLDTAMPCGLVLNELVVNCIKYAFPGGRNGTIAVDLARGEAGTLLLEVSDDGVGLPPGFDPERDGKLGLKTVVSLIEYQLRGTIAYSAEGGTTWTMAIKDDLYVARV